MSIAQDLQIHSNVSIPITPEFREELDPEIEDNHIGKENYRPFLIGASLTLLVLHTVIMVVVGFYLYKPRKVFKSYFMNYAGLGNGYDIAFTILLFLSYILLSIAPSFARKAKKMLFLIVIFLSVFYLSAFFLRLGSKKKYRYNFAEYLLPFYGMLFTASLGLFINVLTSKKKLNSSLGISISVSLFVCFFVFLLYMKRFSPYLWIDLLYVVGALIIAQYLNKNAQLMLNNRYDYYLKDDWFLGFIHLQTDFTFRFWYDLTHKRKLDIHIRHSAQDIDNKSRVSLDTTISN